MFVLFACFQLKYEDMAPELLDTGLYSTSADVFSFGVMLWSLVTDRQPYDTPEFSTTWKIAEFVIAGKVCPCLFF